MFKKVDQLLASLGNMRAMERLHVDTFTDEKIQNIKGDLIAESRDGKIYSRVEELNCYFYLEVVVLSKLKIKTFKGATLNFTGETNFKLISDTQEIESDFSNVSNRFITEISFNITKEDIELLKQKNYKKIIFEFKNKSLTFFNV